MVICTQKPQYKWCWAVDISQVHFVSQSIFVRSFTINRMHLPRRLPLVLIDCTGRAWRRSVSGGCESNGGLFAPFCVRCTKWTRSLCDRWSQILLFWHAESFTKHEKWRFPPAVDLLTVSCNNAHNTKENKGPCEKFYAIVVCACARV